LWDAGHYHRLQLARASHGAIPDWTVFADLIKDTKKLETCMQ
jgi:hypothetical protein